MFTNIFNSLFFVADFPPLQSQEVQQVKRGPTPNQNRWNERSPGANQSSRDVSTSNPASLRLLAPPAPCYPTQVMVHANNDEMLTVSCWKTWIERQLWPVVRGLRESRVFKEIFLVVGNEPLAPWHVERFGGRLFPCLKEVGWLVRSLVGWFRRLVVLVLVDR